MRHPRPGVGHMILPDAPAAGGGVPDARRQIRLHEHEPPSPEARATLFYVLIRLLAFYTFST